MREIVDQVLSLPQIRERLQLRKPGDCRIRIDAKHGVGVFRVDSPQQQSFGFESWDGLHRDWLNLRKGSMICVVSEMELSGICRGGRNR